MTFYIASFEACLFYYLARQVRGCFPFLDLATTRQAGALRPCLSLALLPLPPQGGFTSSTWVEALGADWFAGGPIAQQYI